MPREKLPTPAEIEQIIQERVKEKGILTEDERRDAEIEEAKRLQQSEAKRRAAEIKEAKHLQQFASQTLKKPAKERVLSKEAAETMREAAKEKMKELRKK